MRWIATSLPPSSIYDALLEKEEHQGFGGGGATKVSILQGNEGDEGIAMTADRTMT